jgi:hypothetical protein
MMIGYDSTGMSNFIIRRSGNDIETFVPVFNDKDILLGYVKGAKQNFCIHCIPDCISDRDRAFALLHSKKLRKVRGY